MTDYEKIESIIQQVRDLDGANYATWEAIHWLKEAALFDRRLREQGSDAAIAALDKAAEYSRRFEARYIED